MSKKSIIVNLLRREYDRAVASHRLRCVEEAAAIASANAWDDYKDDGAGSFSTNPYSMILTSKNNIAEEARVYMNKLKEAYEFAVDTFIGD